MQRIRDPLRSPAWSLRYPPAVCLAAVPGPRRVASIRSPLPAILAMAVAAILANHRSVLAIAEWGTDQAAPLLVQLGFPADHTPCQSTLQRLVATRDGTALAATLSATFMPHAVPAPHARPGVAIDGTAQRGRAFPPA